MKKFSVSGSITISVYTEVEAETKEEAFIIAEQRTGDVDMAQYRDHRINEQFLVDDFDGEVIIGEIEEKS